MASFLAICLLLFSFPFDDAAFLGRWDLTVTDGMGVKRPSWIEVTRDGDMLKARMVGTGGGAFNIQKTEIKDDELVLSNFTAGSQPVATVYRFKISAGKLFGSVQVADNGARPVSGERAPDWKTPKGAAASKKPGKPVELFNGKDLTGWSAQSGKPEAGWIVKDGALDNKGKADNIYSAQKFMDFKVNAEFAVGEHGNSGLYLRGRYEVQILDDFGKPPDVHSNGALYGFIAPGQSVSKPHDEWQKLEATIVGGRVTVILNGVKIIDDEEIPGSTGGAIDSHETEPGPILLQGDHAGIRFRKVTVTPLL